MVPGKPPSRSRAGRAKDLSLKDKEMRRTRSLPPVEDGALVLRSSRGHAWLEEGEASAPSRSPGWRPGPPGERHVHLPRWAQVVPGDRVTVDPSGRVSGQMPRRSILRRQAGVKGEQIFAANLDQVMIVVGPGLLLREGFLGRALCGVVAEGLHPILVFQKADLDEDGEMRERARVYGNAGFAVFVTSVVTGEGVAELRAKFSGKTTVLLGQSGVGKSSLVNAMYPGVDLKVGEVDAWGRGKHTTTLARALRVGAGTDAEAILIDLPGVREFGLVELDPRVLARAFPDIAAVGESCRFADCPHSGVDGCAVEEAAEKGTLDLDRWQAYLAVTASFAAGDEGGGRF